VIPLSKIDFVHTRLTHSLEVSVVGRSLGRLVGKKIMRISVFEGSAWLSYE
jgi:dGTPase